MTDNPVPEWAVELRERVARLETKMNVITWLAGTSTATALLVLFTILGGLHV